MPAVKKNQSHYFTFFAHYGEIPRFIYLPRLNSHPPGKSEWPNKKEVTPQS